VDCVPFLTTGKGGASGSSNVPFLDLVDITLRVVDITRLLSCGTPFIETE